MEISWIFSKSLEQAIVKNKKINSEYLNGVCDSGTMRNYLILTLVDSFIQQPTVYVSPSL